MSFLILCLLFVVDLGSSLLLIDVFRKIFYLQDCYNPYEPIIYYSWIVMASSILVFFAYYLGKSDKKSDNHKLESESDIYLFFSFYTHTKKGNIIKLS